MSKFEVTIEPSVLIWARKSAGYDAEEVARALGLKRDKISRWELGEEKPTVSKLERLAEKYKRPLAVFFLPKPPEEKPLPKDFRTLHGKKLPFSPKTRLAMRRAFRLQSLAKDLMENLGYMPGAKIGTINRNAPENEAIKARKALGIDIQQQFAWRNAYEAFNTWKEEIEKLGIFVFQLKMPLEETRGFSLTEDQPPTIVLNTQDAVNGRTFSLLHEYAHLLLNDGGICDMEEVHPKPEEVSTEQFCNHFAGAILVPKDDLLNHELVKGGGVAEWPDEILEKLATDFKVSREVILRRLTLFRQANSNFYKRKHGEWKAELAKKKKLEREKTKEEGFVRNMPRECVRENSIPFISLVLEANTQGIITHNDVADYLGIRLRHLPKIEQLFRRQSLSPI